jgi:DNA-directed RNA polymerase subunit M/transcription elongation factor TFIIS
MSFGEIREEEKKAIFSGLKNNARFVKLDDVLKVKLVNLIEVGINNATFDCAVERKLPQIWNDPRYVEIYSNIGYNVKINLDPDSSINSDQEPTTRYYLSNMFINYIVLLYSAQLLAAWEPDLEWRTVLRYCPHMNPKISAGLSGPAINPARSQKYIDEIELRGKQTINRKFTTQFPCPQCGVRRATFKSVQSRGLDEDNTLFITCDACNHTWKKN